MITFLLDFIISTAFGLLLLSLFNRLIMDRYRTANKPIDLSRIHRVNSEKHQDTIYWFDKDSGEFLGQGLTVEACIKHIKRRFPDHKFFFEVDENTAIHLEGPAWELKSIDLNSKI